MGPPVVYRSSDRVRLVAVLPLAGDISAGAPLRPGAAAAQVGMAAVSVSTDGEADQLVQYLRAGVWDALFLRQAGQPTDLRDVRARLDIRHVRLLSPGPGVSDLPAPHERRRGLLRHPLVD